MKRKALRQVRAGILVVSFTFYLLSCNNKSVKLSDKKIKFPYEDVEDAFVDVDTLYFFKLHSNVDSSLIESLLYFNDKDNGKQFKMYMEGDNTLEFAEYWVETYGIGKSIIKGTSVAYWHPGIIEGVGYRDSQCLKQGNFIEARPDGTISTNSIYKNDTLVKTFYYSKSGELDSIVSRK